MYTYSELLFAFVRSPWLSFQNQLTTRPQLEKHSAEGSLETGITMCQVNPLSDTHCQDHIKLLTLSTQICVVTGHIVTLEQVTCTNVMFITITSRDGQINE